MELLKRHLTGQRLILVGVRNVNNKENKVVLVVRPESREREYTFCYLLLRDATSYETPSSHNFSTTTRIDIHWREIVGIR